MTLCRLVALFLTILGIALCKERSTPAPLDVPVSETPSVSPVPSFGEKPAEWVADNIVRVEGKQLTGWSKTGIDGDLNRWRVKVGIISGELYAPQKADIDLHPDPMVVYADWERHLQRSPVFGIHFMKEF